MLSTLCLASFDEPSRSASGFLLRYVVPRAPVMLYGPLALPRLFKFLAPLSDLIIGTGHGAPDEYSSQNETVIWKVGSYDPAQVKGKVIKLLSCDAGQELGPDLVRKGARCFLGYDDDFLWVINSDHAVTPWNDEDAAACLMPVMDSLNALLDGCKASEALKIERAGYLRNAADTDFDLLRDLLKFNYDHAVLYGSPEATIAARPKISMPFPPPPLLF